MAVGSRDLAPALPYWPVRTTYLYIVPLQLCTSVCKASSKYSHFSGPRTCTSSSSGYPFTYISTLLQYTPIGPSARSPTFFCSMEPFPEPPRPRAALPDVPLLQGAEDLDGWLFSMAGKLHTDGAAIGDTYAQFHYVYARLSDKLRKVTLPYVRTATPTGSHPNALIEYIRGTLEDPNRKKKAGQRLTKIRQGADVKISAYLPEYERLTFEAGAHEWNEEARICLLVSTLNTRTQARLDQQAVEWPATYTEFTSLLRRQEGVLSSGATTAAAATTPTTPTGDQMDVDIATLGSKKRLGKDTCRRCGKPGHWARSCPAPKATTIAVVKPRSYWEDEDEDEDEEGDWSEQDN